MTDKKELDHMKIFALVTDQGTAAAETALPESEFTEENRAYIESRVAPDIDLSAGWHDVTGNEAIEELLLDPLESAGS
jgi:hypothetical protein